MKLLLVATACALAAKHEELVVDVLVYSANPAGIGAAIAAANGNSSRHSVLLMEPLGMIGGMGAAGGVGLMNQGCGNDGISGLGRRWGMLNGQHYAPGSPYSGLNLFPDVYVMADSFWTMLNETAGITTRLGCRLTGASKTPDGCVTTASFLCDGDTTAVTVSATAFIDASYDGDLMVQAGGIDYANGREPSGMFNESLAGVSTLDDPNESFDKQNLTIDAYSGPGNTLLPGISSQRLQPAGSGDDRLMSFAYFPCVSSDANNSVPYPKPEGYDPDDFALLQKQIEGVMTNGRYPDGPDLAYFSEYHYYSTNSSTKLLLCCGVGPVNCDQPDLNHGWATANYTQRQAIAAAHRYYLLGSLYYMANDDRVPNYTRYAVGRWGLCKDEYTDFGYWPPQLYVRISNRLRGMFLMTQNNIVNPRNKPDSVSMGCWEFDQHTMSRHAVPDPHNSSRFVVMNEGYMRYDLGAPHRPCTDPEAACHAPQGSAAYADGNWYDVPFNIMVPQRGQATNLLVPVAISSTSIAYSSTRIEGMFMDLGTAAGVAAALLIEGTSLAPGSCPDTPFQDTNVTAVQQILVGVYQQRIHGPINASLGEGSS